MATNPTSYPLSPPSISGTTISLDTMLQQPTRITQFLSDLSIGAPLIANRIFRIGGPVTGGALIYDQLTSNQLYTTRDVQNVEPGTEFPLVTSDRLVPKVAQVEKFGGKFFVTKEARDRNDPQALSLPGIQLVNTILHKIDTKALAVLEASVTEFSTTMSGVSWEDAAALTEDTKSAVLAPGRDLAAAQNQVGLLNLGIKLDLWIVHPTDAMNFQMYYGDTWRQVLANWGIEMLPSTAMTEGTAYAVQEGAVGEMRFEQPLETEVDYEQATQRTWVQSSVRPVFAVTNPYSIVKVTGLSA